MMDNGRNGSGPGWAQRLAGGWSIGLGSVIAVVAVVAMSTSDVAVAPLAGLAVVVGGVGLVAGGLAVWRGRRAIATAMTALYALLLVWRQFTPPTDLIDPNSGGTDIPVTPTMLLVVGLVLHLAVMVMARRAQRQP